MSTKRRLLLASSCLLVVLASCSPQMDSLQGSPEAEADFAFSSPQSLDPPAAEGALAPELAFGPQGPLLTWIEKTEDGGHSLRWSILEGERWGEPEELASGSDFFANWADRPAAFATAQGLWVAHWLEKLSSSTYAYGARFVFSTDHGERWVDGGLLHDDRSETEHGFVSYLPEGEGIRAFWLDGRAMASEEPMQLRTARIDGNGAGESELLDDRVCECCATSAAATSRGAVVVYRNRSDEEIRDISIVRQIDGGWSEPRPVHSDGWKIAGCPVNGPAIAAQGERLAVAWYTGAGESSRVKIAFSGDAGATFDDPILLDADTPVGRVDLALGKAGEAFMTWIGSGGEIARLQLARVERDGRIDGPIAIAESSESRSSGVPRLMRDENRLIIAWVDPEGGRRVRAAAIDLE